MKKEKNNKNKRNYLLVICLFFILIFIVKAFLFKDYSFYKLLNSCDKIKIVDKCQEMKQRKFEISFNKEDLIEEQKCISVEDAGEMN